MKNRILQAMAFSISAILIMSLGACGDDDSTSPPVAPEISIDNGTYTGDLGDEVSVVISGELDGEFSVLRINKFVGTTADVDFGTQEVTSGLPYTFNYTLDIDGITEPIRINFEVEDVNGLTDNVDLIITTDASREQLLVSFDWRWANQEFEGEETLADCEDDNVWSFESDGSVSLDFGAKTGEGGGSCPSDGLLSYTGWRMSDVMDSLYVYRADAFTGAPNDTVKYAIVSFDQNSWVGDDTNLFGVFRWTFEAQAK